ncbi:alpha/beta-hydrolase [Aspergillus heteromorphus CBS 117.55]|uniref:Alpha/beta-hydrolase n=1 Tax=Aspergillus heteromorphus CBS 117.55 TaxID=1448321 RepID=A0A317WST2_9EURO|nr:alpha/beta-hydrolase [Aspergillus heteromorphus CBS 117.55]PWY89155.1 alpha/beta-hydrolase [Aspergillus heteromorphus CBS 117.55]
MQDLTAPATERLLADDTPSWKTAHPLFPPLPVYGPPSFLASLQYLFLRTVSFVLSLAFLTVVIGAALVHTASTSVSLLRIGRQFPAEERSRRLERHRALRRWSSRDDEYKEADEAGRDLCPPLEGGKDPLVCDVAYYARRVGLDVETFKVQTEDGFVLTLWHVYNPQEYTPLPAKARRPRGPHVFQGQTNPEASRSSPRKYPVLLMHGLLQSAGAYCANDDDSLAFFLCKSGYDVWLGNNRCGMVPEHTTLETSDPRMWTWNIRQMGVLDLPALVSRVLFETGFEKLGLVCHSQGTAETFIALAKDQRPELGERISVFCALAPAVYAGPLVERVYFRFLRIIPPLVFRAFFGIHAFIPFMMTVHRRLHPRVYGTLGYFVFAFLFGWNDARWDRALRDRMFQFAPVYVSAETMRWWLGREGFATQKCILATRAAGLAEVEEDEDRGLRGGAQRRDTAWYGPQTPPVALWIAGNDGLVDGRRLLARLQNGREPHVRLVHAKVVDEYEHLDVLWAMDAMEQVGQEVRQVLYIWCSLSNRVWSIVRKIQTVLRMVSFNPETDIPDLSGRVFLITGGTAGIGSTTTTLLATHTPSKIYITGRNASAADTLTTQLQRISPTTTITFLACDMTSLTSTQSAAHAFLAQESRLDALICNAGIMATPPGLTQDGYEVQFGVNHLAHALLIRLLLPVLKDTAARNIASPSTSTATSTPENPKYGARIILVTSLGWQLHPRPQPISFSSLQTTMDCGFGGSWMRYGQSKLANLLYARELASRYGRDGIWAVSVHPGVVRTGLVEGLGWGKYAFTWVSNLGRFVAPEQGGWNSVWAGSVNLPVPGLGGDGNGGFYEPVGVPSKTVMGKAKEEMFEAVGRELWGWTEGVLGGYM